MEDENLRGMQIDMSDRYRLVALGNEELVVAIASLVRRENELLSDLLAHLAELDERRLYLELGFTSMFAYCTDGLGLCKSSAYRRIAAARVCRQYPDVFARVAAGELQISVLATLSRYLTIENAAQLLDACSRKSCEQVEELLAIRFPKPDIADSIRRLPARSSSPQRSGSSMGSGRGDGSSMGSGRGDGSSMGSGRGDGSSMGTLKASTSGGDCHVAVAAEPRLMDPIELAITTDSPEKRMGVVTAPVRHTLEPLSEHRFGVHFTANGEFKRLLEEVRALASHRQPHGDLANLMTAALDVYRQHLLKERYGVGRKARRTTSPSARAFESAPDLRKRARHVPAAVAREVFLRDGGCCTFVAASGRRCGAKRFLELDHVEPWARHGESTVDNLRLRCTAHNQFAARAEFGAEFVNERVAMRGRRRDGDGSAVPAAATGGRRA
jgi:hypothetical protein